MGAVVPVFWERRYEFEFTPGTWTNVKNEVIGKVKVKTGIHAYGPLDRLADVGECEINLKNEYNWYTPGAPSAYPNWQAGIKFRLRIACHGPAFRTLFTGRVFDGGIDVDIRQINLIDYAKAVMKDYIEEMGLHELNLPAPVTNKRQDEIIGLVIDNMPVQPASESYATGQDVYAAGFDTAQPRTTALSEVAKVNLSEMGYVWVGADGSLNSGGRYTRANQATKQIGIWNGAGWDYQDAYLDNEFTQMKIRNATYYYNCVRTITYPRKVDATATSVLFSLNQSVAIDSQGTVEIIGRYVDPTQEAENVTGVDMVTPVATTDYKMNTLADGSGTDITSSLVITATYGTNGVKYSLHNDYGSTGYVWFLQARGKGVYTYRPVEYSVEDSTLVAADGRRMLTLDMPYQNNPLVGVDFAMYYLGIYKEKRTSMESITIYPNRNEWCMEFFQQVGIGDKVRLISHGAGIDAEYFIQGKDFEIDPSGFITCTYPLMEASLGVSSSYWEIGTAGKSEIGETTYLGF